MWFPTHFPDSKLLEHRTQRWGAGQTDRGGRNSECGTVGMLTHTLTFLLEGCDGFITLINQYHGISYMATVGFMFSYNIKAL